MKEKKIPLRTCIITHEKLPKKELLRVVRTPEGIVKVDVSGKMNGHGAYIKKDKELILKLKNNKMLEKHLEASIADEVYDEMLKSIEEV